MSAAKPRRQEKHTCETCGDSFYGRKDAKTCSPKCRKNKSLTRLDAWSSLKAQIEAMGLDVARKKAAEDDDFRNYLMAACETLADPPRGQERVGSEVEQRVIAELSSRQGFSVVSHDTPLASSEDIDKAEASGDWSPMLDDALGGMQWQIAHGYKPDLSEFDRPPLAAERIAESEKWLRSMEEQAETDSDQEESFSDWEAA